MTMITSTADFVDHLADNSEAIIFFYSPYCKYSQATKNEYLAASRVLQEASEPHHISLGVLDCSVQELVEVCLRASVQRFPAIHYFNETKPLLTYEGKRDKDSLLKFLRDPSSIPPSIADGPSTHEPFLPPKKGVEDPRNAFVPVLTDATFPDFVAKHPMVFLFRYVTYCPSFIDLLELHFSRLSCPDYHIHTCQVLVMFYAPWCGYCAEAKPHFADAAKALREDPEGPEKYGVLVGVDCTTTGEGLCRQYQANSYPTIKLFKSGQDTELYQAARSELAFTNFMKVRSGNAAVPSTSRRHQRTRSRDGRRDIAQQGTADAVQKPKVHVDRSAPAISPSVQESKWVEKMKDLASFSTFLEQHPKAVVLFTTKWCESCRRLLQRLVHSAEESQAALAHVVVDCAEGIDICKKYEVKQAPRLDLFWDDQIRTTIRDVEGYLLENENAKRTGLVLGAKQVVPGAAVSKKTLESFESMVKDTKGHEEAHLTVIADSKSLVNFVRKHPLAVVYFSAVDDKQDQLHAAVKSIVQASSPLARSMNIHPDFAILACEKDILESFCKSLLLNTLPGYAVFSHGQKLAAAAMPRDMPASHDALIKRLLLDHHEARGMEGKLPFVRLFGGSLVAELQSQVALRSPSCTRSFVVPTQSTLCSLVPPNFLSFETHMKV